MDKCQQFIDKVSELRFLKIKERQVNKFNRLLLKKQGNITWFSAVPPTGNPQAESAGPQVASTSSPKADSSWAESTAQASNTSSPQISSPQAVSTVSQGDKAVHLQAVSSQAISTNSQGDSTVCLQGR